MQTIDVSKLKRKKKYLFQTEFGAFPKSEYFIKYEDLLSIPVVETEKVVYCKECVYKGNCSVQEIENMGPNDFCSHGKIS